MNSAVIRVIENLPAQEQKEILEVLGTGFLIKSFSQSDLEDFETDSPTAATMVARVMQGDLQKDGNKFARADALKVNGKFKVGFFK